MPNNELSYKDYPDGTRAYFRDDVARGGGLSDITDKVDVQEISISSPGTGTAMEKATNVITSVLNNITLKRPYTIVNVIYDGIYRGQMNISAVASTYSYSIGTYMSYYTDFIFKFINANGTITVNQLFEYDINTISAPIIESRTTVDLPIRLYETGDEDYKGIVIYDKNNQERYRLLFTGGHLKFTSKNASGTTIVDTTLA